MDSVIDNPCSLFVFGHPGCVVHLPVSVRGFRNAGDELYMGHRRTHRTYMDRLPMVARFKKEHGIGLSLDVRVGLRGLSSQGQYPMVQLGQIPGDLQRIHATLFHGSNFTFRLANRVNTIL